jgi:hypothetical protein
MPRVRFEPTVPASARAKTVHTLSVIITVLKSVTRKRLVKTEDFHVSCGCGDIWSVWFSESVIIAVLKSVAKKRLLQTENLFMCAVVTVIFGVCSVGLL